MKEQKKKKNQSSVFHKVVSILKRDNSAKKRKKERQADRLRSEGPSFSFQVSISRSSREIEESTRVVPPIGKFSGCKRTIEEGEGTDGRKFVAL